MSTIQTTAPQPASARATDTLDRVTFRSARSRFAIEARRVREILALPMLSPLEDAPTAAVGAFDLRGDLVKVLSLEQRLGHKPRQIRADQFVLIIEHADGLYGLIIDHADDVRPSGTLLDAYTRRPGSSPVQGEMELNGQLTTVLDPDRLLGGPSRQPLPRGDRLEALLGDLSEQERTLMTERAGRLLVGAQLEQVGEELSLALFEIDGARFAVPTDSVREFTSLHTVVPLPSAPLPVMGVAVLRGELVTVIDPRSELGLGSSSLWDPESKMVFEAEGELAAFPLDRIDDLVNTTRDQLRPIPGTLAAPSPDCYLGALMEADHPVPVLLPQRLVTRLVEEIPKH
ncbi:MAG: chemotaxis protein CheW [Gammaproteobacteria bacterium]